MTFDRFGELTVHTLPGLPEIAVGNLDKETESLGIGGQIRRM
jgi:hypothetical protein